MFKVQQNRYLWVHLVGLATVPLLLDVCLAGLASVRPASSGPASAFGLQFWAIALICILPPAWMQIQRPFYIYSLPPLAIKPSSLSEDDRRRLTVLTSWQIKALAGLTAIFSLWLLARLYDKLPQILPAMEPGVGLISAAIAFFFACLFLQISVSVVRSLLIGQETLQRVKPFEASEITSRFLIPGLRIDQIFPTNNPKDRTQTAARIDKPRVEKSTEKTTIVAEDIERKLTKTDEDRSTANTEPNVERAEIEVDKSNDKELANSIEEAIDRSADSLPVEASKLANKAVEDDVSLAPIDQSKESIDLPEDLSKTESKPILEEPPIIIPEIINDNSNLNDRSDTELDSER